MRRLAPILLILSAAAPAVNGPAVLPLPPDASGRCPAGYALIVADGVDASGAFTQSISFCERRREEPAATPADATPPRDGAQQPDNR